MGLYSAGVAVTLTAADVDAVVSSTVAALRAHPAVERVHCAGCFLLGALPFIVPQLAVVAAEAGAMEALLLSMHAAVANSQVDVLLNAFAALGNLAGNVPARCRRVHATGAVADVPWADVPPPGCLVMT